MTTDAPLVVPKHLGIMPDGTRRWAARRGLSTTEGYREGAAHLLRFFSWCDELGIASVTAWLVTERNVLHRPPQQVPGLLAVITDLAWDVAKAGRWRLAIVGNMTILPGPVVAELEQAASSTAEIDGRQLVLGVGYGGRLQIVHAVKQCLARCRTGDEVTEQTVTAYLAEHHQPELELIIRTSGEQRLSDMGGWQVAWSEMYFTESLWQDFTRTDLDSALEWFNRRNRRHGR
jgi:short-chain Z-isoprenyl diphosphate synthase